MYMYTVFMRFVFSAILYIFDLTCVFFSLQSTVDKSGFTINRELDHIGVKFR